MVSLEELKILLNNKVNEIDNVKLFYTCKAYGYKRIRINTNLFRMLKIILAYHQIGIIDITASMVAFMGLKPIKTLWDLLHKLGDYHILIKLRGKDITISQWRLHPLFLNKLREHNVIK